jgi:hypothetical protein
VRATAGGVREGVVSAGRGEAVQCGAGPSAHADWCDMRISSREIYHKRSGVQLQAYLRRTPTTVVHYHGR